MSRGSRYMGDWGGGRSCPQVPVVSVQGWIAVTIFRSPLDGELCIYNDIEKNIQIIKLTYWNTFFSLKLRKTI